MPLFLRDRRLLFRFASVVSTMKQKFAKRASISLSFTNVTTAAAAVAASQSPKLKQFSPPPGFETGSHRITVLALTKSAIATSYFIAKKRAMRSSYTRVQYKYIQILTR